MLLKWYYDLLYRFYKPPWDTGITPPEVVAMAESGSLPGSGRPLPSPGIRETQSSAEKSPRVRRALDLGCGTGTNSIYLAKHGFSVVGVDFSSKAIALARAKAREKEAAVDFHVADATRLDFLSEPFDLVLDIGCFHTLDDVGRWRYAKNLVRLTCDGSLFMLYAFGPRPGRLRTIGITEDRVRQVFSPHFGLYHVEHGQDRGEHASAWYWFVRQ